MNIYILFTIDDLGTKTSRILRGAFTDKTLLNNAIETLKKNGVVEIDKCNKNKNIEVVIITENCFEDNGGCY